MNVNSSSHDLNTSGKFWDTPNNAVPYSEFKMIHAIFIDYVSIAMSLIGIPTNVVSCLVFWRQGLQDRVNMGLWALALVDLFLFINIFVSPTVKVFIDFFNKPFGDEFMMKSLACTLGVTYGLRTTSDVFGMIIAVDRCLCVVLPLRVAHLIRTRTMAAMMAASFVFLQLCHIVFPLKFTVAKLYVNATNSFEWKIVQTEIGSKYANILDAISNTFLCIFLPVINFVIVIAATVMTVVKLTSARRWREKTSSSNRGSRDHQAGATKMLVVVSSLYIVTMTPYVAAIITRLVVPDFSPYGRYYLLYNAVLVIADRISLLNDAVNVFVYLAQSSRFRSVLHEYLNILRRHKLSVTRVISTVLN